MARKLTITSTLVQTIGAHDHVSVWVDGAKAGELVVSEGQGDGLARMLERASVGGEPHWLVKDFNALYRVAEAAVAQATIDNYTPAHLRDLARQIERLLPAFETTERERAILTRGRKG